MSNTTKENYQSLSICREIINIIRQLYPRDKYHSNCQMGKGGWAKPIPLIVVRLPAVLLLPPSSTIFSFSITHNEDVSLGVNVSLVFSFTADGVCCDATMKGFVTPFEQVGVVVSWFAHFGFSFLDSRRSGCSRHHCELDTTTY